MENNKNEARIGQLINDVCDLGTTLQEQKDKLSDLQFELECSDFNLDGERVGKLIADIKQLKSELYKKRNKLRKKKQKIMKLFFSDMGAILAVNYDAPWWINLVHKAKTKYILNNINPADLEKEDDD